MKKKIFTVLAMILLPVLLVPSAAQAGGLAVTSSSAVMDFPSSLTFSISAESDADITDIRLHYTVDRTEHAHIISEVYISFTPAKSVTTQYVMDMRRTGGFPPGSSLTYWWTATDAGGKEAETLPERVMIEDGRYDWQSSRQGMITLYWYNGDEAFAAELMDAAQQALGRLAENSGAELEKAASIYIYGSSADLQGSMIFPQEWTGGVAYSQYGIIAIGIAPTPSQIAWGKRAISHELTHLVVHQVTFNPYNDLPTWLDEGLAVYSEGALDVTFASALNTAEENNTLISVRSLASPFSAYADQSILAYAESYAIVAYLINEYGRDKMLELLDAFRRGSGYDEALLKVYRFDMDGLNLLWENTTTGMTVH